MLTTRALALFAIVTLAACGSAAAPSSTFGPQPTERPTPTPVIGDPGSGGGGGGTDPGSGGGSGGGTGSGKTGGGIIFPIPGDPNQDPLFGEATYVTPAQGLTDQRTVNVQLVRALINEDATVTFDLRWWSGVAPCNQLDHVEIARDDDAKTIRFTVVEGSGPGDMACIDIAQLKGTQVDLGALASGSWKISAEGDAREINLEVP